MSGCAGPEQKLGRGVSNMIEITRLGELRRSYRANHRPGEPEMAYTTGVFHGIDRTVARTAAGFYEVATFPFPNHSPKNYGPIFLPRNPVDPDSYSPVGSPIR